jgi:hypothetical protein
MVDEFVRKGFAVLRVEQGVCLMYWGGVYYF